MDQELWSMKFVFVLLFGTENKESQLIKLSCSTAKYTYSTRCQHLQGGQQHQQVVWQQQGGGGHYGRGWLQGGGQGQKVAYKAKVVNNTKVGKNAKVFNNRVVDITSRWQWSPARWITRNLKYWVKQGRRTQGWAKGSKSQPRGSQLDVICLLLSNLPFLMLQIVAPALLEQVGSLLVSVGQDQRSCKQHFIVVCSHSRVLERRFRTLLPVFLSSNGRISFIPSAAMACDRNNLFSSYVP